MKTELYNPHLLTVSEFQGRVGLHYNLTHHNEPTWETKLVIDLGEKSVDRVAEQCRIKLRSRGIKEDGGDRFKVEIKEVLDIIQELVEL